MCNSKAWNIKKHTQNEYYFNDKRYHIKKKLKKYSTFVGLEPVTDCALPQNPLHYTTVSGIIVCCLVNS